MAPAAVAQARAYSVPASLHRRWIIATWSLPVVLSLAGGSQGIIVGTAVVAAVVSCGAIILDSRTTLIALPFFALLSPVAGFFNFPGGRVLLSDALFIALAVQLSLLVLADKVRVTRSLAASLAAFIALLYAVSTLAGMLAGTLVSLKPLLYLAQLVIIGFYTGAFAKNRDSWALVVDSWIIATLLGALLLINAFIKGRSLSRFDLGAGEDVFDLASLEYLFRADYYYTGFHFAVGASIVVLLFRLLLGGAQGRRILSAAALAVLLAAILMMLSKTAILSIGLTLLVVWGVLLPRLPRRTVGRAVMTIAAVAIASYVAVSDVFLASLGELQRSVWGASAIGTSSFAVRLSIYGSAFSAWLSHPIQILLGMGPDFLDRSGDPALALTFKTSSATRLAEGTVDSGWVSYLIELGILAFAALLAWVTLSVRSVYECVRRTHPSEIGDSVAVPVLAGLVFTVIALSTQMLGYTKVSWFPFQLLLIGLMHAARASPGIESPSTFDVKHDHLLHGSRPY